MKFNALFIRAIALTLEHDGDANAEALFNALYPSSVGDKRTPSELLPFARSACGASIFGADIRVINAVVGVPRPGCEYAVSWIKEARTRIGCGLKEAKDLYDFVRDNPTVAQA